jgi:hypothetical protein
MFLRFDMVGKRKAIERKEKDKEQTSEELNEER